MAKCHLQIRHKSPGHRYRPGDEIRGTLIVEAHEPCHCEWARVLLTWRAEGDHDTDTGVAAHEQFSVGTLEFDSQREFPFQFTLPSRPPPYAGQTLQIQYSIAAAASVPAAPPRDAFPDIQTDGSPPEAIDVESVDLEVEPGSTDEEAMYSAVKYIAAIVSLVLVGGFFFLFGEDPAVNFGGVFVVLVPLFVLAVPYLLWRGYRATKLNSSLGYVYVKLTQDHANAPLDCRVDVTEDDNIMGVEVSLHIAERSWYQERGSNRQLMDRWSMRSVFDGHATLGDYYDDAYHGQMSLPAGRLPTPWSAQKNKVVWTGRVIIDLIDGSRWTNDFDMHATPVYRRRQLENRGER